MVVQKSHEEEQASFCAAEGIRMIDEEYGSGHHRSLKVSGRCRNFPLFTGRWICRPRPWR